MIITIPFRISNFVLCGNISLRVHSFLHLNLFCFQPTSHCHILNAHVQISRTSLNFLCSSFLLYSFTSAATQQLLLFHFVSCSKISCSKISNKMHDFVVTNMTPPLTWQLCVRSTSSGCIPSLLRYVGIQLTLFVECIQVKSCPKILTCTEPRVLVLHTL